MIRMLIVRSFLLLTAYCSVGYAADPPVTTGVFPQEIARHRSLQQGLPSLDVSHLEREEDGRLIAYTAAGAAILEEGRWNPTARERRKSPVAMPPEVQVRQWAAGPSRSFAVASDQGLFEKRADDPWQRVQVADGVGRLWATSDVRGVTYDANGRLWFATRAGVGCRLADGSWTFYTGHEGLPYNDFTCCAAGQDGSVWWGTRLGAIRFKDGRWSYRQGLRWLPHDEVRSITVELDGTAWFATAGGVGCIDFQPMTLAEKATYYENEIDQLIKRTPYGYVAEAQLRDAGDKSHVTNVDSDNDGLWTAMYGASQCYAYAVTKSPESKRRATQAFEALKFLQDVTEDGSHSPPDGFVARTILPTDGPDPNEGQAERDRETQTHDRLWKTHSPRWPKSKDGRWYWKSDTSSDELDGHFFLYALYFDLVAETPAEKQRVQETVAGLANHLVDNRLSLVDHDGRVTRWAVYHPEAINHDVDWMPERGLNSLAILAYLAVAEHVTGDPRYERVAEELRRKDAYHTNAMLPKVQRGLGSGNQSDDEMAFMDLYHLVKYTKDPELRQRYLIAFYWYWTLEQPERNPFFHFAYAAFGRGQSFRDPFGDHDLSPWHGWLDDSLETLRGFPLDRCNWSHTNSHRLDLVRLPRQSGSGHIESSGSGRGHRIDGKVLPVEERFFTHWNTDPWQLDTHGSGHELANGTVFLLPYYMGRHHGFLTD